MSEQCAMTGPPFPRRGTVIQSDQHGWHAYDEGPLSTTEICITPDGVITMRSTGDRHLSVKLSERQLHGLIRAITYHALKELPR